MMQGREGDGMGNMPMTLELSADHHIITTLLTIKEANEAVARIAVEQLFDNACIAAGTLDDPRVLLSRLNKVLEMFIYQGAGFDYASNQYMERPEPPVSSAEEKPADKEPTPEAKGGAKFEEVKDDKKEGAKFEEMKPDKKS